MLKKRYDTKVHRKVIETSGSKNISGTQRRKKSEI